MFVKHRSENAEAVPMKTIAGHLRRMSDILRWNLRAKRRHFRRAIAATLQKVDSLESRVLLAATPGLVDSFESGLPNHWAIPDIDGEGRVGVRDLVNESLVEVDLSSQFTTTENAHALVFDSSRMSGDTAEDLSIAILTVNISGVTDALLTFHQLEGLRGDINHELPDKHTLLAAGDGLAISQDGTNWYAMRTIQGHNINRGGDGLWQLFEFDLVGNIARVNADFDAGIDQAAEFQIKFSQYDNDVFPRRGWAIDNVSINVQSPEFTRDVARGVVHRFRLDGENEQDYYYRAALYGEITPQTPILISTHGSNGDANYSYSQVWHRFAADPNNSVSGLIVIAPAFVESTGPGRFNTPRRYSTLSWNTADDAAADLALLETVETVAQHGLGDDDQLLLWGFSAGGQFTGRFTAAHPDRVAAAVVGSPSSQIFADNSVAFPYGTGHDPDLPEPEGVVLDAGAYRNSRIMYFVGQDDDDPEHSQLGRGPTIDSLQGSHRLQRSVNQFEQISNAAGSASSTVPEFELFISEGDGHGGWGDQTDVIFEFLTRNHDEQLSPVKLHSRVTSTPSSDLQQAWLPPSVQELKAGAEFLLELWIESPIDAHVESGGIELYFDETLVEAVEIDDGLFSDSATGTIDNEAGRIRALGGAVSNDVPRTHRYSLFKRIRFELTSQVESAEQLLIAPQRLNSSEFLVEGAATRRTDFLPLATLVVEPTDHNKGTIQGVVFQDDNANGVRDPNESPIANRTVSVLVQPGDAAPHMQELGVEPDDSLGEGAYLTEFSPNVRLTGVGSNAANSGVRVRTPGAGGSSTGTATFAMNETTGFLQSYFLEDQRELRMEFAHPTQSVSIDAVAHPNTSSAFGRLEAYDHDGNIIGSTTSGQLSFGMFETLTVSSASNEIAYSKAFAISGSVRLDNLQFTSAFTTTTDENGFYRFEEITPGDYVVSTELMTGEGFSGGATPDSELTVGGSETTTADVAINEIGLIVSPHESPLRISEGTGRAVHVSLSAKPPVARSFSIEAEDTDQITLSTQHLYFTPDTWNTPQEITVTAVNDNRIDGDAAVEIRFTENGVRAATLPTEALDDDVAGFIVTQTDESTTVSESGTTDSLIVALTAQPLTNVVLALTNSDPLEVTLAPSSIVFKPDTWNIGQMVTISGEDDVLVDGPQTTEVSLTVDAAQSDDAFDSVEGEIVTVTTIDNDLAGFIVQQTAGSTSVTEGGQADTFSVVLTAPPVANVVFLIDGNDATEVAVSPASLTFTPANWNVPQVVTVSPQDDPTVDGTVTSTVGVKVDASASQAEFHSLPEQSVSVTTVDNDLAAFSLSESGNATEVSEGGATDAVAVVLDAQPLTNVVFRVIVAAASEVNVDKQTLTFTPETWNVSQSVAVAAIDDDLVEGVHSVDLTLQVDAAATDPAFSSLADQAVVVKIIDDDLPGFTITESDDVTSVAESETQDSFSIVLDAQPMNDVVLTLINQDLTEVQLDKASLTFSPANWNAPQTVIATGVNDIFADGTQTTGITVAVNADASDDAFDTVPAATVEVTTADDEVPGLALDRNTLTVHEDGTTAEFTVKLAAAPLTNVRLLISTADQTEAATSPNALVFTSETWNIPQTVAVAGADDAVTDGDQTTNVIVAVDSAASDSAYTNAGAVVVSVTTIDNDETATGDVDGDDDFDANDSFLVHLVQLSGTDAQIDQSKGNSGHTASEIRDAIGRLNSRGDVDGDSDFDANDSLLIHLVRVSGTDTQIDQSKGASELTASEIRSRVETLGQASLGSSRISSRRMTGPPWAFASSSSLSTTAERDLFATFEPEVNAHPVPAEEILPSDSEQVWNEFRSWIDAI